MNTVFHVTSGDPDDQARALSSVGNLLSDDTVALDDVAFVANSSAVRMFLRGATNAPQIRSLAENGVAFKACSNSLQRVDIAPEQLLGDVEVVSSGMGELTRLQSTGYAYIRL
ncbi:DsrE family protein [Halorarius litoreus]|uniref:DsrE family protein n=1 Tax=Halorarius litoreus TaxID=2962676 RepID=UPI0020CDBBBB|nr:DsrE family protein [Halorarius litoreus]